MHAIWRSSDHLVIVMRLRREKRITRKLWPRNGCAKRSLLSEALKLMCLFVCLSVCLSGVLLAGRRGANFGARTGPNDSGERDLQKVKEKYGLIL